MTDHKPRTIIATTERSAPPVRTTTTRFSTLVLLSATFSAGFAAPVSELMAADRVFTLDNTVNTYDPAEAEATRAGQQYWFADKQYLDGRTLKLSVVRPGRATHAPHRHEEDEFFFVLEGTAEFYLDGNTRTVGPYTSLYCPPNQEHGIRNIGDSDLKYLVIKKYNLEN